MTDSEVQKVTQQRGEIYGHPSENFANIANLWSVVLGKTVTMLQVSQCMRLVKEARLMATPDHADSLLDIKGYAECSKMILDRLKPTSGFLLVEDLKSGLAEEIRNGQ